MHIASPHRSTLTVIRAALAVLLALSTAACIEQASASTASAVRPAPVIAAGRTDTAGVAAQLAAVKRATARFNDVRAALAEGYVEDEHCVAMPGTGAMGVHFIHPARMGMVMVDGRLHGTDTVIDPSKPEILVYAPQPDGTLRLGAVEYYTSQAAWGERAKPTIFGTEFNTMADDPATAGVDEGHGFTPHYDLHVWMWQDNPNGLFAQWNPTVTCPATPSASSAHAH